MHLFQHGRGRRRPQPVFSAVLDDVGRERHDHVLTGRESVRRLPSKVATIARPSEENAVVSAGTPSKRTLVICRSNRLYGAGTLNTAGHPTGRAAQVDCSRNQL